MLRKRANINKLKKVDNKQIKGWIREYNISFSELFKS